MSGHQRLVIATQGFRGGDGDITINQVEAYPKVAIDELKATGTVISNYYAATVVRDTVTGSVTIESIPANLEDTEVNGSI